MSKHCFSLSFAVIQLLAASTIFAGGIYLTELGTPVSLGTAGVGNVVNNVSPDSAFTNPAGMTGVKQDSTLGGVQALVPVVRFDSDISESGCSDGGKYDMKDLIQTTYDKINESTDSAINRTKFRERRTMLMAIEKRLLTLSAFILISQMPYGVLAAEEGASSGAAASDPTAAVNYQDVRYRYFDLERGDKNSFETEGAFMLSPRLKITNELRYVETDSSGKSEQDFEQLKLKAILLTNGKPFGVKAKYAVGVEWQKDLGDLEEGTGNGADIIAPLVGIGWVPDDNNFIVTLLQYFHSYDTESDREDDVRETGPRLIWIRSIPDIKGWFKADLKMSINHEDDNDFSQVLEFQLGKMFSPRVGCYAEIFLGDDVMDTNAYNIGGGIGLRYMY